MRRVDRHRLIAAAIACVLIAGAAAAVYSVATRRLAAMQAAALVSRDALRRARAEGASVWAPDELRIAERAAADALARQRAEDVRLWPIPSADPVIAAWGAAEQASRLAAASARDRQAAARAADIPGDGQQVRDGLQVPRRLLEGGCRTGAAGIRFDSAHHSKPDSAP